MVNGICHTYDKLLKELALDSIKNLIEILKNNPPAGLQKRVIEAMTTNETSWFRDGHPFEILKKVVLPEAAKKRQEKYAYGLQHVHQARNPIR